MAEHLSLSELGVTHIHDMGAIGNEPPPMDWHDDFGLDPLPKAAPAMTVNNTLGFGT